MSKKKHHQCEPEEQINPASQPEAIEPEVEVEPSNEEKIRALEAEICDLKDKYLRSMAEFENFRRRSNQEKADWIKLSTQRLALSVCDVLDNFERALMQITDEQKADSLVKGFVLIEQQLRSLLEKEGIKKIEALGAEFDPAYHEALAHIPSETEENTVAAIIQNGYTMHDKVVRPARVAVSNGINPKENN